MSLLALAVALAFGAPPHLAAARAAKPPSIDGLLGDPEWRDAPATEEFTQKFPDEGQAPTERTTVRVLYDADAIYVAVDCEQRHSPTVARLTRRDRKVEADSVTIALDTKRDGRSAFEFSVSAAGVLSDGVHFNDTDFSSDWDENWEGKVRATAKGWSAEIRVPLRILRYDAAPEQSFGLQIRRYVSTRQETDEWAYIPRNAAGEVSHYGKLEGLTGLRAKTSLELRPFVVGRIGYDDPRAGTLARGWGPGGSAGLDLKWHVNQRLTLDATFNPDFGQVEADQVVLNLTSFEVFYPEKRPFFLESVDIFATPIQLVYTRRIGRAAESPALRIDPPFNDQLYRAPQPATIYGAAKLTGELGNGVTIGELLALTAENDVTVVGKDGVRTTRVADPLTAFKVLRLKRDIGDRGHIGLLLTSTNHLESTGAYPVIPAGFGFPAQELCPGAEVAAPGTRCYHDSYVGSVDGRWRSPSGDYVISGQALGSLVHEGPPRLLPDGTTIQSGDAGGAGQINIAKEGGKHFVWDSQYDVHGRRVDYNDLGFMRRQNQHHLDLGVELRTLDPNAATLETHTRIGVWDRETLGFLNIGRGGQIDTWGKLANHWGYYGELHYQPAHYDDREVGDGAALERAGRGGVELAIGTDTRSRIRGELWTQTQRISNGWNIRGEGLIGLKVLPELDVDLLPTYLYTDGEPRWFATEGASYLFGRLRAASLGATLRATYTFTPRLTFQAYAQAFLASKHYYGYSSFPLPLNGGPPVIHLTDLRQGLSSVAGNPDNEEGALNVNLVLRWEYLLGSTLFLVYTHAQNTSFAPIAGADGALDFHLVTPRAASEVFLLKVSYWWG